MEFDEVFMCPFTTATTCYSGARRGHDNDNEKIVLATENHILGLSQIIDENDDDDDDDDDDAKRNTRHIRYEQTSLNIPRDKQSVVCVGYSRYNQTIQALVLVDQGQIIECLQDDMTAIAITNATHATATTTTTTSTINTMTTMATNTAYIPNFDRENDAASVFSGSPSIQDSSSSTIRGHNRHNSGSTVGVGVGGGAAATATTVTTTSLTSGTNPSPSATTSPTGTQSSGKSMLDSSSSHGPSKTSQQDISDGIKKDGTMGSSTSDNFISNSTSTTARNTSKQTNKVPPPKGRLILQVQDEEYFALLDYRPLCPCVAKWGRPEGMGKKKRRREEGEKIKKIGSTTTSSSSSSSIIGQVGVWVGSADDASLRLYRPASSSSSSSNLATRTAATTTTSNEQDQSTSLLNLEILPEEHFSVDTLVMAIDFLSITTRTTNPSTVEEARQEQHQEDEDEEKENEETINFLAVACQDGTIQLIWWKDTDDNELRWKDISSYKVIVDGPLLCLQLQELSSTSTSNAKVQVVVGSLCGYVCQLIWENNSNNNGTTNNFNTISNAAATRTTSVSATTTTMKHNNGKWTGPYMIVQGFWNNIIQLEDSVIAIHTWDYFIAIGTQMGRCLIYKMEEIIDFDTSTDYNNMNKNSTSRKSYKLIWECLLPYPIHGIMTYIRNINTTGEQQQQQQQPKQQQKQQQRLELIVTTKRSIHIFFFRYDYFQYYNLYNPQRIINDMMSIQNLYSIERLRNRLLDIAAMNSSSNTSDEDHKDIQEEEEEEDNEEIHEEHEKAEEEEQKQQQKRRDTVHEEEEEEKVEGSEVEEEIIFFSESDDSIDYHSNDDDDDDDENNNFHQFVDINKNDLMKLNVTSNKEESVVESIF